ncbi:MAG TPA: glycosyltransferase family 39 protein [Candidatus Tectomicrobia bacterium]|nr:glycosyltransferase family 39 protein [Candidatus Tectomicrobia bacterium]
MDVRKTWAFKRWADVDRSEPPAGQGPHRQIVSVGVLGLALVLLFYHLGDGSLHDWDEAIYAQVAREMLSSHSWTTLTWNGALFFHKPPLHFWYTALTYKMLGVSEFAARLWPAMFGFGVVVLTFILGMRLRSWMVGAAAALLLLVVDQGYYGYWWNFLSLARVGMLDTALTFWVMLALLLVWESEQRPRLIVFIGLPIGMAVMTKAWVGLLAAGLPMAYWLIAGRRCRSETAYWAVAILLASMVILPWHVWQYAVYGPAFLHDYVGVHLMGRMVHAFEGNAGGPLNYLDILRRGFSIWGYLWPLAYLWAVWRASAHGDRRTRLLLAWITIPLLLFSLAQTKLGWYISLIYPAIALLLGLAVAELLTQRVALGLVAAVMFVCCLRLPVPTDGSRDVKLFALQAIRSLPADDPVYVAQKVCGDDTWFSTSAQPLMSAWDIRPSLRFYMNRPLRCFAEREILAGLHPRPAYVIGRENAWSHIRHGGRVVFEGYGFVLARWE